DAPTLVSLVRLTFEPVGGHEVPQPGCPKGPRKACMRHRGLIDCPALLEGSNSLLGELLPIRKRPEISDVAWTPAAQRIFLIVGHPDRAHPVGVLRVDHLRNGTQEMHQRALAPCRLECRQL